MLYPQVEEQRITMTTIHHISSDFAPFSSQFITIHSKPQLRKSRHNRIMSIAPKLDHIRRPLQRVGVRFFVGAILLAGPSLAENPAGYVAQIAPGVWFREGSTMDGTG